MSHELHVGSYDFVNITMTPEFLQRWLPDPATVLGRRFDVDGRWSAALTAFAVCLTPTFASGRCPLPERVVTDQLGTLLMLATGTIGPRGETLSHAVIALHGPIMEHMREYSGDYSYSAQDAARSFGLEERALHEVLAANGQTFAAVLLQLRLTAATQLRASSIGRLMTSDEIARLTGFKNEDRLTAALRNQAVG
jgi:AraC-like DNA-binding protein